MKNGKWEWEMRMRNVIEKCDWKWEWEMRIEL